MKKIYTLIVLLAFCTCFKLSAQQVININVKSTTSTPAKPDTGKPANTDTTTKAASSADTAKGTKSPPDCSVIKKVNTLSVKKNGDGSYQFILKDDKDNPMVSFNMQQYNKQLYIDKVTKAISSICNDKSNPDWIAVRETLISQYTYEIILEASLEVPDIDVIAGTLKINKTVNMFSDRPEPSKVKKGVVVKSDTIVRPHHLEDMLVGQLKIFDLQIQFQDGFIENIVVHAKLKDNDTLLKFEGTYPISFSAQKNFDQLINVQLFEKTIYANDEDQKYLFIGDLLKFDPNYRLNTKDYFPDNQIYKADITNDVTSINLNREKTSKILAVQVFSDLKGASSNSPNGLVQINFGKKLNLYTKRIPIRNKGLWKKLYGRQTIGNFGLFNYFTPEFTLSKIESDQKNLVLNFSGGDPAAPAKPNVFATTLNLLLYQQYQIGGKLNLLLLDLPALKSTLFINGGFRYGRTSIQDTLRTFNATTNVFSPAVTNNVQQYGVNSFQIIPEIQWTIYPDERYGFCLTQQFNNYRLLAEQFKQIDDVQRYNKFLATNPGAAHYHFQKWVGTSEIVGFIKASANNEIFLRYRYNWDLGNAKNNFNQIQVGITTFLTASNTGGNK